MAESQNSATFSIERLPLVNWDSLATIGPSGVLTIVALLLMFGKIQPISTVKRTETTLKEAFAITVKSKDDEVERLKEAILSYRDASKLKNETLNASIAQVTELFEIARVTDRVLRTFPEVVVHGENRRSVEGSTTSQTSGSITA